VRVGWEEVWGGRGDWVCGWVLLGGALAFSRVVLGGISACHRRSLVLPPHVFFCV